MPRSSSSSDFARVEIDSGEETETFPLRETDSDAPFRIAVLGDFSGRASRGLFDPTLKGRRFIPVDRDNFDEVMERMGAQLETIRFTDLDDFHPDRLYEQLPIFQGLRETRDRLQDRATFPAAAAEVQAWSGREAPVTPDPEIAGLKPEDLFDRMLDDLAPGPAVARPQRATDEPSTSCCARSWRRTPSPSPTRGNRNWWRRWTRPSPRRWAPSCTIPSSRRSRPRGAACSSWCAAWRRARR